ncbi:MAG: MarR family transcriptional regulator [Blastocatellia bacterium]|nr:MarR family transcriptional regulator [Blastocatellia bacterium]
MAKKKTPQELCAAAVIEIIPFVMHHVRSEVGRRQDATITVPQLRLLALLKREPQLGLTEVATMLGITQATASATADRLVQRGLVRRETDSAERRRIKLSLTETGQTELGQMLSIAQEVAQIALTALSPEQLADIIQSLGLLREAFSQARLVERTTARPPTNRTQTNGKRRLAGEPHHV